MTVLITGGAGFIGSHTVDFFLKKGVKVCVVDNLSHGSEDRLPKNTRLYVKDICNAEDMFEVFDKEKPEVLIHLAAQTKVDASVSDPVNDAEVNIIGTLNLMEAGRRNGLKWVVYASTAAVYGEQASLPIKEMNELNIISGYGVSKHAVECYLQVYRRLYSIGYCSLRYSNVFGPRQEAMGEGGVIAVFAKNYAMDKAPTIFGTGEATRDFVYVKDVAYANYLASIAKKDGIYNISTNIPISINALIRELNTAFKRDVIPIYASSHPGDILASFMSYDKAKAMMGWEPRYSFSEGLKETLEYYNELYG